MRILLTLLQNRILQDMHTPQSVAGILFSPDRSQVFLTKRRDVPVWVLPGGGIESNETPEEAVVREILEETGFHVKIRRLVGVYIPINRLTKVTHLYECEILKGEPKTSNETRACHFFPLNQLPKHIPPPYLEWIEDAKIEQEVIYKKLDGVTYTILLKNLLLHPVLVLRFLLARAGFHLNSKD